jgi:hypothetical protein
VKQSLSHVLRLARVLKKTRTPQVKSVDTDKNSK